MAGAGTEVSIPAIFALTGFAGHKYFKKSEIYILQLVSGKTAFFGYRFYCIVMVLLFQDD
jgi:hypothetical protein